MRFHSPRRTFIDTEFGQMHVRISKPKKVTKRPLVCLHMSPQSGAAFVKFMTAASQERIVVAPDYHGFGESDHPPADPSVRVEDYARTIWQAMDALDLDKVDLLGHHTGSKVAAEMAHQFPARVGSIAMISASTLTSAEFDKLKQDKQFDPIALDTEGTRFTSLWHGFREFCDPDLPLGVIYDFVLDALRPGDAYQWGNRAAFLYNENFTDVLQSLPHKITVFNPNDDLYEITPKIMPYLKNGQLISKENWQHGLFEMNTGEIVESVLTALDTL